MKKKVFTICLIAAFLGIAFIAGFSVTKSQAKAALGFGGRLVDIKYCDCSHSSWLFYAPFWGPAPAIGGALNYAPYSTITYSFYNMTTPGVWHLGMYLPGVQGCWIAVSRHDDWVCVSLPVLGQEIMVGTSLKPDAQAGASDTSVNTLNQMGGTQPFIDSGMQIPGVNVI